MNTYVRDYKLNFHDGEYYENLDVNFIFTDFAMQAVEYTNSAGTLLRTIATREINEPKLNFSFMELQDQIFEDGSWFDIGRPIRRDATRSKFINSATNEQVSFADAITTVDDLTKEILDVGDVSFDPPQYEKKTALKPGFKSEFDDAVGKVGSGLITNHDYHKGVIMNTKQIQLP